MAYVVYCYVKGTDVLLQNLMEPWSCEIHLQTFPFALKFEIHLGYIVAEMLVKF